MHPHLAVDAGVVAALEVHPLPLHQSADALRAVAAPDGRVSHAVDAPVLRLGSSASMRRISRATSDGSIFTPVLGVPVQP